MYIPQLAQFSSKDLLPAEGEPILGGFPNPAAIQAALLQPYVYAGNDPINKTDPSGLLTSCTVFIDDVLDMAADANRWWQGPDVSQRRILGENIACRWVPRPISIAFSFCPAAHQFFTRPPTHTGFCPQLNLGGQQGGDIYRHLAFSMAAKLKGLTVLSLTAESQNCSELRQSCSCAVLPSTLEAPSRRCMANQSEVIGDILGREAGKILKKLIDEQITPGVARVQLENLLCGTQCDPNTADHCCPGSLPRSSNVSSCPRPDGRFYT